MEYIEKEIYEQGSGGDEELFVYKTGTHSSFLTYDGIDVNGKRISDEILEKTDKLNKNGNRVVKFSIVGFSIGGLISRYAIGILLYQNYFKDIIPVNFVTFCTPHVGVLRFGNSFMVRQFNRIIPAMLANTGYQIFLQDKTMIGSISTQDNKRHLPLLVWMSEPNSIFYKALSNFRHKTLYANIINDKRTQWFTSAIMDTDPFRSASNNDAKVFDFEYERGFEPTVINISKPFKVNKKIEDNSNSSSESSLMKYARRALKVFTSFSVMVVSMTVRGLAFGVLTLIERIKLSKRLSIFFREISFNHLYLYDDPSSLRVEEQISETLENEDTGTFANIIERKLSDQVIDSTDVFANTIYSSLDPEEEYLHAAGDLLLSEKDNSSANTLTTSKAVDPRDMFVYSNGKDLYDAHKKTAAQFKLDVSPIQARIIKNLNTLGWQKFPLVIRNVDSTHSVAIYRQPGEKFKEGKASVRHFVSTQFHLN